MLFRSLLGGDVQVRSAPGAGSRFILSLPRSSPTVSIGSDDHQPAETGARAAEQSAERSQPSHSRGGGAADPAVEDTPREVRAILDASRKATRATPAREEGGGAERS